MEELRGLSPAKRLYLKYWTALGDLLEQRDGIIKSIKPASENWLAVGIGDSQFRLDAGASVREKWIYIALTLRDSNAKPHFHLLKREKADIEKEIGLELEWDIDHKRKQNYIRFFLYNTDPEDRGDWDRQHRWLCDQLETFYKVFSRRVKELNANDYRPEENEIDK